MTPITDEFIAKMAKKEWFVESGEAEGQKYVILNFGEGEAQYFWQEDVEWAKECSSANGLSGLIGGF